ncbi:MAG: hypothetical protein CMO97_01595 [Woeseia sp.]|nr:hypothetical protein [Woeseia sp.]
MWGLNVAHVHAKKINAKVNIEFHWSHGEDYLTHPKDPETIIERTNWINTRYHLADDVVITHMYNSDLFNPDNTSMDKKKHRFYFDDNSEDPNGNPEQDWIFKKEEFVKPLDKIVIFTPTENSEPPRHWKRFLTNDDWDDIIQALRWRGWDTRILTYRTPIRDAYTQIQESRFVVCYDGMWHKIGRNFSKPMMIPSKEGVTYYNTPNAVRIPDRESFLKAIGDGNEHFCNNTLTEMNKSAEIFRKVISKCYED